MRLLALLAALLATVLAAASAAALATPAPTYTIVFAGAGTEHHVDTQQNIQDSGLCDSAEHVDVTASLAWSTAWPAFRAASTSLLAQQARIAGSEISGSDVKDACGLPPDQAPEGWVGQSTCQTA